MAYNYYFYAKLAWRADAALLALSLGLSTTIVLYMIAREYSWNRRNRALLDLKRHVYEIVLSGVEEHKDEFARLMAGITPEQFLDITTNRNRSLVFFNDAEQTVFKKQFVSPGKVARLKRLARRPLDKWRRIEAMLALGYSGVRDASGIIEKALFSKDEDVSYFSMISLGQLKDASSAKALLRLLKKNPLRGHKIISILENFPAVIIDDAIGLLKDRDIRVRILALELISKFKARAKNYAGVVEYLIRDISAEVRSAACQCLGAIGEKSYKALLVKHLKDDSWLVRASAIEALSRLLGAECIPAIIDMVGDPSLSVIDTLKDALLAHAKAAMPYLEKFLFSDNIVAKKLSVEIMERSGRLAKLLNVLLSDDAGEKKQAIYLLRGMVASGSHFGLESIIAPMNEDSRGKILSAIGTIDAGLAGHIERKLRGDLTERPGV